MEIDKNIKNSILQPLTLNQSSPEEPKALGKDVCDCTFCEHSEEYEIGGKKILQHLYFTHRLVIADAHEISDLKEYLSYWKQEFRDHPIEEYCTTMLWKQLPDGTKTESDEKYFLLSDIVPKDKEIRLKIQQKAIEKALARHQFERHDENFIRGCLFCRSDPIEPTRYAYVEHLFEKHFLHLGKPENLVFIDELIDHLEDKLVNLICIYCEKIFKDRPTLKEHMRKKGHKKINPENKAYDRYFMVNYKIKEPQAKITNRPNFTKNQSSAMQSQTSNDEKEIFDNDEDWSEWSEQDGEILIKCLFCSHKNREFNEILSHQIEAHEFNFNEATADYNFYQKVKLVNFIRRKIHLNECFVCDESFAGPDIMLEHVTQEKHLNYDREKIFKPEFYFPTYEDDNFLCHLDNNFDEMTDDSCGAVLSEDRVFNINEDAEMLSKEKFIYT